MENNSNSTPHKRRRQTSQALEALGQLIKDPSIEEIDGKLNKNDILSLTIARLLRRKYLPANQCNVNMHLTSNVERSSPSSEGKSCDGFLLVMNTSGRIIFVSDNVENYLRKNVRALYPQLTSIYQCVNRENHEAIHHLLANRTWDEQSVICTWNLPRGKRPSRTHTESKAMLMTGHFTFLQSDLPPTQQEPVFIARCEQILSSTPNIPSNSLGATNSNTLRVVLNEQMHINEISTNVHALLGFQAEDLFEQSVTRLIASEYWHLLNKARENCILGQHCTTMNVLDMYNQNGDRLTFLCNTYLILENRRKGMKFGFLAQLIDPSTRNTFVAYAEQQNLERLRSTVQQETALLANLHVHQAATMINNSPPLAQDQYLGFHSFPSVCPVTVIPQRRKRRRVTNPVVYKEGIGMETSMTALRSSTNDCSGYHHDLSSTESSTSSASPIQEIGSIDDFFPYLDEMLHSEKFKLIPDFPQIDDCKEFFGLPSPPYHCHHSFSMLTPTMSTACSFFA